MDIERLTTSYDDLLRQIRWSNNFTELALERVDKAVDRADYNQERAELAEDIAITLAVQNIALFGACCLLSYKLFRSGALWK